MRDDDAVTVAFHLATLDCSEWEEGENDDVNVGQVVDTADGKWVILLAEKRKVQITQL